MGAQENPVQKSVLFMLRVLAGAKAWRNNTRTIMMPGQGGRPRPVFFGEEGAADVLAILPPDGHFLAVETKKPGWRVPKPAGPKALKPSEAHERHKKQTAWGEGVQAVGGTYMMVTNTIALEKFLRSRGLMADIEERPETKPPLFDGRSR